MQSFSKAYGYEIYQIYQEEQRLFLLVEATTENWAD